MKVLQAKVLQVYIVKKKIITGCYCCGHTLPIENATPHPVIIRGKRKKDETHSIAFLCGTCDLRKRAIK